MLGSGTGNREPLKPQCLGFLGFGVWGLGFLGFGVQGLGFYNANPKTEKDQVSCPMPKNKSDMTFSLGLCPTNWSDITRPR